MENTINIKTVVDRVLRNPLLSDLNFEAALDYAVSCLRLIATPYVFEDKIAYLRIENYRVAIPCDMLEIIQTRCKQEDTPEITMQFEYGTQQQNEDFNGIGEYYEYLSKSSGWLPMRYASDTFQTAYHCETSEDLQGSGEFTYSINNGVLYANFKDGWIQMSYKGLALDETGLPLIPDDEKIILCVEAYIKYKHYMILWEMGKIPDKIFNRSEKEYEWYVGAAQSHARHFTMDKMETLGNSIKRLVRDGLQQYKYYNTLGAPEIKKRL